MLLRAFALLAPLLEVEWAAPEECPAGDVFVERVEAQVDQEAQDAATPVLTATVVIEELPEGRWRLTLQLHGGEPSDPRRFEADSCAEVVEAAVVVVAVRVVELVSGPATVPEPPPSRHDASDGGGSDRPTDVEPVGGSVEAEAGNGATPRPRTAEPTLSRPAAKRPRSRVGGWLAVQGGLALGLLPGVGGAVGLEGGVRGKWWRAGLAVHGAPVRRRRHPQAQDVEGRFDLVSGEALACGVPAAGPVVFPLCGRVALGAIRGVGRGRVDAPTPRTTLWSGIGGSVGAAWRVTRSIAPFFSTQVLATLRDSTFSVGTLPGVVHDTGSVAFRAWLGVEFHL